MKRYGTLASLEMLDDKEQEDSDSEGNEEWDSDTEEDCNKNKTAKEQGESRKLHSCSCPHMWVILSFFSLTIGSFTEVQKTVTIGYEHAHFDFVRSFRAGDRNVTSVHEFKEAL